MHLVIVAYWTPLQTALGGYERCSILHCVRASTGCIPAAAAYANGVLYGDKTASAAFVYAAELALRIMGFEMNSGQQRLPCALCASTCSGAAVFINCS